jgi:methionine-rich copper-binding protein CopC
MSSNKACALLTGLLIVFGLSSPAFAHDQRVDIQPAAGESIAAGEVTITLLFGDELLTIPGGNNAEVLAKLEGSETWIPAVVETNKRELSAVLQLQNAGSYKIKWKVVTSDGHPITGESTLEVEASNVAVPETAVPEPFPLTTAPSSSPGDSNSPTGLFYLGLTMVVLGAVFAPIGLVMRRRSTRKS